jgi:[acyl-carrier-protein] S-malonyltransferase
MDLLELPAAQAKFAQAEAVLGWSVTALCQSEADLSRTLYTQPCLYVVESILADLLRERGQQPDFVAGHSLGEYTALYSAGVFEFAAGLKLIQRRAELMDAASNGMMAALLGCDRDQLQAALQQNPDAVLANDNNAGQVVISGTPAAVETVIGSVKSKKAVKLNVSGAFHSPLMASAAAEFAQALDAIDFHPAKIPVLSNTDPTPATDPAELKARLSRQMTGSVRWREISLQLPEIGVERVVEVGPGKVLLGIIKRTAPTLTLENVGTIADLPQ